MGGRMLEGKMGELKSFSDPNVSDLGRLPLRPAPVQPGQHRPDMDGICLNCGTANATGSCSPGLLESTEPVPGYGHGV